MYLFPEFPCFLNSRFSRTGNYRIPFPESDDPTLSPTTLLVEQRVTVTFTLGAVSGRSVRKNFPVLSTMAGVDVLHAVACVEGLSYDSMRKLVEGALLRDEPVALARASVLLAHDVAAQRLAREAQAPAELRDALSTRVTFVSNASDDVSVVDKVFNCAPLLRHVLSFLSGTDVAKLCCVCWAFASSLTKDKALWKKLCQRDSLDPYNLNVMLAVSLGGVRIYCGFTDGEILIEPFDRLKNGLLPQRESSADNPRIDEALLFPSHRVIARDYGYHPGDFDIQGDLKVELLLTTPATAALPYGGVWVPDLRDIEFNQNYLKYDLPWDLLLDEPEEQCFAQLPSLTMLDGVTVKLEPDANTEYWPLPALYLNLKVQEHAELDGSPPTRAFISSAELAFVAVSGGGDEGKLMHHNIWALFDAIPWASATAWTLPRTGRRALRGTAAGLWTQPIKQMYGR